MTDWIWQHIIGPALNGVFGLIPWWVWLIVAALALGWAWRTFGWQGLVAVGLAVLTLGAYRKGWKDRNSLGAEHIDPDSPDALPPLGRPKPKRPAKPAKPPVVDTWFDKVRRGDKAD
jgi:hypothetical protein